MGPSRRIFILNQFQRWRLKPKGIKTKMMAFGPPQTEWRRVWRAGALLERPLPRPSGSHTTSPLATGPSCLHPRKQGHVFQITFQGSLGNTAEGPERTETGLVSLLPKKYSSEHQDAEHQDVALCF